MEYLNLLLGLVILIAFMYLLVRNHKRSGFIHSLGRIETIMGIVAGLYLIGSSAILLLSS